MSKKLHNPKSYAPAVYIPCWLIQVPIKLLSHGAKITYGRLSQWASSNGTVYRSVPQLCEEIGCSVRSVEEYLRELKSVGLIGTYHPQAGGVNHFEFYDHEWMHEPINDNLVYKQDKSDPTQDPAVGTTRSCGGVPHDRVDINIKEIKVTNTHTHSVEHDLFLEGEQQRKALMLRESTKKNDKCQQLYEKLPQEIKADKSFNDIHDECVTHYATQTEPKMVSPQRLMSWIKREIKYHETQPTKKATYQKPGDSFNQYMKSQKTGGTYDQHGNTYDPLG